MKPLLNILCLSNSKKFETIRTYVKVIERSKMLQTEIRLSKEIFLTTLCWPRTCRLRKYGGSPDYEAPVSRWPIVLYIRRRGHCIMSLGLHLHFGLFLIRLRTLCETFLCPVWIACLDLHLRSFFFSYNIDLPDFSKILSLRHLVSLDCTIVRQI